MNDPNPMTIHEELDRALAAAQRLRAELCDPHSHTGCPLEYCRCSSCEAVRDTGWVESAGRRAGKT